MQPEYETVVEASSMITSGLPLLIHVGVVALQVACASFLGIQGLWIGIRCGGGWRLGGGRRWCD